MSDLSIVQTVITITIGFCICYIVHRATRYGG